MEQARLYRKESLDRVQSPEQLNDYLRVTNPSVWILLTAVILLLVGLLVWGSFTYIDSMKDGRGEVSGGVMTIRFDDDSAEELMEAGMKVFVGETETEIGSLGRDEQGFFAMADTELPDGIYDVSVRYKQTQIMKLLFH